VQPGDRDGTLPADLRPQGPVPATGSCPLSTASGRRRTA
jgi:hypothetical protein